MSFTSSIEFSAPRRNLNGGQTVVLKDKQTKINPVMTLKRVHWISNDTNSVSLEPSEDIQLQFKEIDKMVQLEAFALQKTWFGKNIPSEKMKSMYCPSVNGCTLKAKLSERMTIFDALKQPTVDNPVGRLVDIKLAVVGVFFKPGRFGVSYVVRQVKLLPVCSLDQYAFDDSSQDDFSDADSN